MANKFCDTGLATGANDGSSFDNAWQSIKTALESTAPSVGDVIWIRRRSGFASAAANIATANISGTQAARQRVVAWPRTTVAITSSDWTSGSRTVVVDDGGMDREKHQARIITGPDSREYVISRVVDANTIMLLQKYLGTTVTNQAATISADEYYSEAQAIDDSAWTIKKTDWNGDAHDLPKIDFEATGYYVVHARRFWLFQGLEFAGGTSSNYGSMSIITGYANAFRGCLFAQPNDTYSIQVNTSALFERCTFEGDGAGGGQRGIYCSGSSGSIFKKCASYNMGDWGLRITAGIHRFEDCNVGVEVANGDVDLACSDGVDALFIDCEFGMSVGFIDSPGASAPAFRRSYLFFENFQRTLGAHYATGSHLWVQKTDVVAGSGDPYKRTGGADSVLAALSSNAYFAGADSAVDDYRMLAEFHIAVDDSSKSYRFYCQLVNKASLTPSELILEAVYTTVYGSATLYRTGRIVSDETVSQRSGADDWSQYIEVTGVQPAVAGMLHLRIRTAWYDTDGVLYIDPQVVIS